MITTENNTYIVAGYEFETEKDAKEAEHEQQNIMALKSKIDFTNSENMLKLYKRLIDKQVFRTPVGIQFLAEFREFLISKESGFEEDEVPVIKVERRQGMTRVQQEQFDFLQVENQRIVKQRSKYIIAIAALITVIIAMFVITALNPNVGYINTENKILNRYAEWEERLTEKEKILNEREIELNKLEKKN